MKRKEIKSFVVLILIFSFNIFFLSTNIFAQEENESTYSYTGEMNCLNDQQWTNNEWQFYKIVVEPFTSAMVNLSYEGTLDLDLRFYWKRDNSDEVGFNGFDVTHCGLENFEHSDNSQLRTLNTTKAGQLEELEIINPSYTKLEDKTGFILIFVYNGTGISNYTLRSDIELTKVNDFAVYDCNHVIPTLIIYLILVGVVVAVLVLFLRRKKNKLTQPDRTKKGKMAEESEKDKGIKHFDLDTVL